MEVQRRSCNRVPPQPLHRPPRAVPSPVPSPQPLSLISSSGEDSGTGGEDSQFPDESQFDGNTIASETHAPSSDDLQFWQVHRTPHAGTAGSIFHGPPPQQTPFACGPTRPSFLRGPFTEGSGAFKGAFIDPIGFQHLCMPNYSQQLFDSDVDYGQQVHFRRHCI